MHQMCHPTCFCYVLEEPFPNNLLFVILSYCSLGLSYFSFKILNGMKVFRCPWIWIAVFKEEKAKSVYSGPPRAKVSKLNIRIYEKQESPLPIWYFGTAPLLCSQYDKLRTLICCTHIHTELSVMLFVTVSPVFQSILLSSHVQTHIKTQSVSYHANAFTYTTLGTISSRMQTDFLSIHNYYSDFCTCMSSQRIFRTENARLKNSILCRNILKCVLQYN